MGLGRDVRGLTMRLGVRPPAIPMAASTSAMANRTWQMQREARARLEHIEAGAQGGGCQSRYNLAYNFAPKSDFGRQPICRNGDITIG